IEVTTTPARPRWKRWLAACESLISRLLPFTRRWLAGAILDRCGRVYDLRSEGRPREAFALAIKTLPECLTGTPANRTFFWLLLTHAAQLVDSFEDQLEVLEALATTPGPGASQEAAVLEEISRWPWRRGDAVQAVQIARDAVNADPAWPWAHVTLAFYLKTAELGDPLPELTLAVRADPACLPEIEKQFGPALTSNPLLHPAIKN
ncbi:MAG TPA: hypothetical protein VH083_24310, partial [Myxococcales bacterium]|nr:hypothetical protein [Myxococcales bacterium]